MSNLGKTLVFGGLMVFAACGPSGRTGNNTGDDDTTPDADTSMNACLTPTPEGVGKCADGIDNDCDGMVDCGDPDCSGVDGCPVCGQVLQPMATPLALPDGVESGTSCSTDAMCAGTMDTNGNPTPNCIVAGAGPASNPDAYTKACHASYVDTLHFVGFGDTATLTDTSKLLKVCAKMEHSWVRDLNIELVAPNGSKIQLLAWQNRTEFEEIYPRRAERQ